MKSFEYRHVVTLEETNLVGNVYFVNHIRWQGKAREHFLREHCPEILGELESGLALVTLRCECDYLDELRAFDEVVVRMRLSEISQNRLTLSFEYWRLRSGGEEALVARGVQEVTCLERQGERSVPVRIPPALERALEPFG